MYGEGKEGIINHEISCALTELLRHPALPQESSLRDAMRINPPTMYC